MLPKTVMRRKEIEGRKDDIFSCFSKSESAAATAIAAVLLLALAFTIISVVKLEYVPDWKNDAEMNYVHDIWNDMVGAKTNIDTLCRLMGSNNYLSRSISVAGPVNMGGGEIPFLEPSKSNGKLDVNTERYAMTIVPRSLSQKIEPDNFTIECGGITCYPENKQYPNQIFRYENGALILANGESSVMRQPPAITIEEDETDKSKCTVIIQAIQLSSKRDSTSSNTIIPLQLTGYKTEPVYDSTGSSINAFNLTIATKYPDAWIAYFNEIAQDKGLKYGKDYTVQYLQGSGHVRFSFLPNGDKTLKELYVSRATIGAGLGTGSNFDYDLIKSTMKLKQWYCFDTITGTHNGISLSMFSDPSIFKDYDPSKSPLSSGNSPGVELIPYSLQNEFSEHLNNNDNLDLTLKFSNYAAFDVSPKQATILMIYKYDNDDPKKYKEPTMEMSLAGQKIPSINQLPAGNWRLYSSSQVSVSPSSPSDLIFNLKVVEGNNGQGTFHLDYLAIYLS
jgi:hypothetical protein